MSTKSYRELIVAPFSAIIGVSKIIMTCEYNSANSIVWQCVQRNAAPAQNSHILTCLYVHIRKYLSVIIGQQHIQYVRVSYGLLLNAWINVLTFLERKSETFWLLFILFFLRKLCSSVEREVTYIKEIQTKIPVQR